MPFLALFLLLVGWGGPAAADDGTPEIRPPLRTAWTRSCPGESWLRLLPVPPDRVLAVGRRGSVQMLRAGTGAEVWSWHAGRDLTGAVLHGDELVVLDADETLCWLDLDTGRLRGSLPAAFPRANRFEWNGRTPPLGLGAVGSDLVLFDGLVFQLREGTGGGPLGTWDVRADPRRSGWEDFGPCEGAWAIPRIGGLGETFWLLYERNAWPYRLEAGQGVVGEGWDSRVLPVGTIYGANLTSPSPFLHDSVSTGGIEFYLAQFDFSFASLTVRGARTWNAHLVDDRGATHADVVNLATAEDRVYVVGGTTFAFTRDGRLLWQQTLDQSGPGIATGDWIHMVGEDSLFSMSGDTVFQRFLWVPGESRRDSEEGWPPPTVVGRTLCVALGSGLAGLEGTR